MNHCFGDPSDAARRYGDLFSLPHHTSAKHPPMPIADRAAQFAPFAALTGHADRLRETARITDRQIILDEERAAALDRRLQALLRCLPQQPPVEITYFVPDATKSGGRYVTVRGRLKKTAEHPYRLFLTDGTTIEAAQILALQSPMIAEEDAASDACP